MNFIQSISIYLSFLAGVTGKSADELMKEKIAELLKQLPGLFDTEKASVKHPISYDESMNTVLQQELIRLDNY